MLRPQLRAERGQYHTFMNELRENDTRKFKNYTRLSKTVDQAHIPPENTHFRKAIPLV